MKFSKTEWIISVGAVLGLFLAAIVIVALALGATRRVSARPPVTLPQQNAAALTTTAKDAYPAAEALARRWHDDAQLSRITAAWRQPTETQLLTGKTSWAFYFYSPSVRETYIVSVAGQTARQSRVSPAPQVPPTISSNYWQVDSPKAIRDFLEHGGRQFLQEHPQSSVHLQLNVSEKGQVEWSVIGLSAPDEPTVVFFLNATSGMSG